MEKRLIVSQYNENVEWTTRVPPEVKVLVCKKYEYMPNVGREAGTYAKYIFDNYYSLDGMYYFVQGNPFDHAPTVLEQLREYQTYHDFGVYRYTCDMGGTPQHSGLPILNAWKLFVGPHAPETIEFTAGAQFAVSADVLRKKPREYYEQLMTYATTHPQAPWVLERLWRYILT